MRLHRSVRYGALFRDEPESQTDSHPALVILRSTCGLGGAPDSRTYPLQDEATRAWNLYGALHYKAGGVPWRLVESQSDFENLFYRRQLLPDDILEPYAAEAPA